jgi:hypothetical protein
MKKIFIARLSGFVILAFAVLAVGAFFGFMALASAEEKQQFLSDKHQSKGLNCNSCHRESPPKVNVPTDTCLKCHGDYAKLAEKTIKLERNPHGSHEGDLPCESCHHAHKQSENHCAKCHPFDMKVP